MPPRCAAGSSNRAHHQRGCTLFFQAFPKRRLFHETGGSEKINGNRAGVANRPLIQDKSGAETNSGPFTECFSSRRSVPTAQRGNASVTGGQTLQRPSAHRNPWNNMHARRNCDTGRQACFPDFSCAECMEEKLCGSCLLLPRTLRPHREAA